MANSFGQGLLQGANFVTGIRQARLNRKAQELANQRYEWEFERDQRIDDAISRGMGIFRGGFGGGGEGGGIGGVRIGRDITWSGPEYDPKTGILWDGPRRERDERGILWDGPRRELDERGILWDGPRRVPARIGSDITWDEPGDVVRRRVPMPSPTGQAMAIPPESRAADAASAAAALDQQLGGGVSPIPPGQPVSPNVIEALSGRPASPDAIEALSGSPSIMDRVLDRLRQGDALMGRPERGSIREGRGPVFRSPTAMPGNAAGALSGSPPVMDGTQMPGSPFVMDRTPMPGNVVGALSGSPSVMDRALDRLRQGDVLMGRTEREAITDQRLQSVGVPPLEQVEETIQAAQATNDPRLWDQVVGWLGRLIDGSLGESYPPSFDDPEMVRLRRLRDLGVNW